MNLAFRSLWIPDLVPQSMSPTVSSFPLCLLEISLQETSPTRLLSEGAGMSLSFLTKSSMPSASEVMAPLTVPPVRILITRSRVSIPEIPGMPNVFRKSSIVLPPYIGEGSLQYSLTTSPLTWMDLDW